MNLASPARLIYGFTDWFDPALEVGSSFVDPVSGVQLKLASIEGGLATVQVTYGTASCVRSSPSITCWTIFRSMWANLLQTNAVPGRTCSR